MRAFRALLCAAALAGALASAAAPNRAAAQDGEGRLTPKQLQAALAAAPQGEAARRLAERIRQTVGAENLRTGRYTPQVEEVWALLAIEAPGARSVRAVPAGNIRAWPLSRIGETDVWAAVAAFPNFAVTSFQYEIDGRRTGGATVQLEYYPPHPESLEQPGVPKGTVTKYTWSDSRVYPGTTRDYWVYVPAQYTGDRPAAVMVFQDGESYLRDARVATVFDNLIHKGDMPVTVGIFVNPGRFADGRSNRSVEYDTLSDRYARFLRDEILPEVGRRVKLTDDPERRAICGISSGGICAFTVAWEMPDLFRKVLSHVGSFVNIASGPTLREGGHNYPALIRKTPNKPLRVYLQDGANDLDNEHGNWPLANQEMAAALRFKGYDYRFDFGQGFHSMRHGAAILPDSLRWLWRDVR